jgi:hypothetical protein
VENPSAGDGGVVLVLAAVARPVTLDVSLASRQAARQRSPHPRRRPATPAIVTAVAPVPDAALCKIEVVLDGLTE